MNKIMNEQQVKADTFITNQFKKGIWKNNKDWDNPVNIVPIEIKKFKGFTAIPPFLRIFPSQLSLQSLNKNKYVAKEEKSQLLKIKNKRDIEDKLVKVSLLDGKKENKDIDGKFNN